MNPSDKPLTNPWPAKTPEQVPKRAPSISEEAQTAMMLARSQRQKLAKETQGRSNTHWNIYVKGCPPQPSQPGQPKTNW